MSEKVDTIATIFFYYSYNYIKSRKNILKNEQAYRDGIPKKQPNKVGTNDTTVPLRTPIPISYNSQIILVDTYSKYYNVSNINGVIRVCIKFGEIAKKWLLILANSKFGNLANWCMTIVAPSFVEKYLAAYFSIRGLSSGL